jgi:SAM-dependent methyltransferase
MFRTPTLSTVIHTIFTFIISIRRINEFGWRRIDGNTSIGKKGLTIMTNTNSLLNKINRGLRYRIMGKVFYYSSNFGSGKPNRWQQQIIRWNQSVNEKGWVMPYVYSKKDCLKFWQELGNESTSTGNRPEGYAKKDKRIIEFMRDYIQPDIDESHHILELGCNAGGNLNVLLESGYQNLTGIEINPHAIEQLKISFPILATEATLIQGDIAQIMSGLKDSSYDLIFTMAVAMHVHPEDNMVFKEMVRLTKRWLCTIEPEEDNSNYVFARNYKRYFEQIGMRELRSIPLNEHNLPGIVKCKGVTIRLFEKVNT